jgi:hypothetical protein
MAVAEIASELAKVNVAQVASEEIITVMNAVDKYRTKNGPITEQRYEGYRARVALAYTGLAAALLAEGTASATQLERLRVVLDNTLLASRSGKAAIVKQRHQEVKTLLFELHIFI